jgi:hypothetical protein
MVQGGKIVKERLTKLIKEAQERYIYAEEQAQYLMDKGVDCVKRGEWKKHFSYGCWHYDCPFCDDGFATKEDFIINQLPKYCSNCGAKMNGGEG